MVLNSGSLILSNANIQERTYRLVGGKDVKISDYPYLVYIKGKKHFCVGTIITAQFILTSAECVKEFIGSKYFYFSISAGTDHTSEENLTISLIEMIHYHPHYLEYKGHNITNNLALIEHSQKIKLSSVTKSIELFSKGEKVASGTVATLIGWEGESIGNRRLRKLNVPVHSRKQCDRLFKGKRKLGNDQICAGKINTTEGPCLWDTGAPLVIKHRLVGVLSEYPDLKEDCNETFEIPVIYTSIAAHHKWIDEVTYESDYFKIITNISIFMLLISPLMPCLCFAAFMYLYKKCFRTNTLNNTRSSAGRD